MTSKRAPSKPSATRLYLLCIGVNQRDMDAHAGLPLKIGKMCPRPKACVAVVDANDLSCAIAADELESAAATTAKCGHRRRLSSTFK